MIKSTDPYFRKVFEKIAAEREAEKQAAAAGVKLPPAPVIVATTAAGYPLAWANYFGGMETGPKLECFGEHRWNVMTDDAAAFLKSWGKTAHLLGWTTLDLFGVHPAAPAARFDVMGLIPVLNGGRVIAITKEGVIVKAPSGATLSYQRTNQAGAVPVTARADNEAETRG
jgi:hypothetical protein